MNKTNTDSKNFCILPWIHMHIWPNGITYPCCLATNDYVLGNTNNQSFQELWNSERMRELRKNIQADQPTSGCSRCYEHEEQGARSMRQNMNNSYKHLFDRTQLTHADGSLDDVHMAYMDIRFSNICNMRCRTCGPELSSQWVDDAVKLKRYSADAPRILKIKPTLDEFWADIEPWIDTVENIYFAGGEPLIMDEHYRILEHLIDIGKTDIQIAYNTNFSKLKYKRHDVVELWKHFRNVTVGASLDAMGSRAELMRKGTNWSEIEANRQRLLEEAPHVKFQISCTVSLYNAYHCTDFLTDWIERGWIRPQDFDINVLLYPEYQRAEVLPADFKRDIQYRIEEFIQRHDLEKHDQNGRAIMSLRSLAHSLNNDRTHLTPVFLEQDQRIDQVRAENLYAIFPELSVLETDQ